MEWTRKVRQVGPAVGVLALGFATDSVLKTSGTRLELKTAPDLVSAGLSVASFFAKNFNFALLTTSNRIACL